MLLPTLGATIVLVAVTVVIVDDHDGFRAMARRLLEGQDFDVVGEAADGAAALTEVAALGPRLVLLDLQLPDTDGFAVAGQIAASHPGTAVVLTSVRPAADYGGHLPSASALGFVPKAELSGEVLLGLLAEAE